MWCAVGNRDRQGVELADAVDHQGAHADAFNRRDGRAHRIGHDAAGRGVAGKPTDGETLLETDVLAPAATVAV